MNVIQYVLPLVVVVLLSIPLIKVFRGKANKKEARNRLFSHIGGFFLSLALLLTLSIVFMPNLKAADPDNKFIGSMAQGLGYIGIALSTGLSALGAGIAVAAAAPAAIGAFSENEKNFGKSLIFVALGEGVAIYGILISILLLNNMSSMV